jgi:hypothetical protein
MTRLTVITHFVIALSTACGAVAQDNSDTLAESIRSYNDGVRWGRYEVAASVPSMEGCPAATDRATVTLRAGSRRSVPLEPHPCGQLMIEAQPIGARFTLVASAGDDPPTEGTIPATLILPSGRYRLTATPAQSYCTAYRNDDVRVVAEKQTTVRFRMLCEKP